MACRVARCWRIAAWVAPTHERWLAAATPSPRISLTAPKVPSCVEPPAPKVTEQNSGLCAYSAWRVARSLSALQASWGEEFETYRYIHRQPQSFVRFLLRRLLRAGPGWPACAASGSSCGSRRVLRG